MLREMIADFTGPHRIEHRRGQFDALADDALHAHPAGADLFRGQDQAGVRR